MLTLTSSKIVEIFVDCDDFINDFSKEVSFHMIGTNQQPISSLSASEIITICIIYHHSRLDCFKSFYTLVVKNVLRSYFPHAPSYTHFIKLKKYYLFDLFAFLWHSRLSKPSNEANFVDSKKLQISHIKRAHQHRVMKGLAEKGKTSIGWFYGLKLHLIINEYGQPCSFLVTSGNKTDNNEEVLKTLFRGLQGIFYGDKGYLTKLKAWLKIQGVELITKVRKNMKKPKLTHKQKHYLKRRSLIETVFGLMTFQCDLDHSRHRSQYGFFSNIFSAIIAYTYLDSLPQMKRFSTKEIQDKQIVLFID